VNNGGATPTPPVNNGGAAPTPPGRYGDHRDVAPSLFGATPDGNQIHAWKQGGTGNCASIACIKAATDAYGKEGVFDGVTKREDGGFDLKLQDGRSVSLTAKELETAKRYSQFHELGKGTDLEHAQLTYGAMAKNKQELMGYRSFESALSSLNDGENPRDAARWLGIPKDRIQELTSKGVAGQDSIVAWNNRHAVFVDRALGQGGKESHQYDLYGRAMDYGSGSRLETRRGRFGRTYQVQVGGNPYPNAFGFSPRPQPTPPVNGGGAAPQPPVNNGGGGAVVPPVNNGGGGGAVVPPVNNGGGAVVPPVNSGGGGAVVPPVNGGGGAAPVTDTTPKPPAEVAFDHTRYQDALKAAHESGRPLVMKVGASWCGPCQAMKRGAFADPAVQKMLADRGVFLDVENDRHGDTAQQQAMAQQISQQLGVRSYPTTMIANVIERDGSYVPQVIDQRAGMMGAQQLQAFLAQALEQ
jgi:thiol-disulfide isomerase/thioredoxin